MPPASTIHLERSERGRYWRLVLLLAGLHYVLLGMITTLHQRTLLAAALHEGVNAPRLDDVRRVVAIGLPTLARVIAGPLLDQSTGPVKWGILIASLFITATCVSHMLEPQGLPAEDYKVSSVSTVWFGREVLSRQHIFGLLLTGETLADLVVSAFIAEQAVAWFLPVPCASIGAAIAAELPYLSDEPVGTLLVQVYALQVTVATVACVCSALVPHDFFEPRRRPVVFGDTWLDVGGGSSPTSPTIAMSPASSRPPVSLTDKTASSSSVPCPRERSTVTTAETTTTTFQSQHNKAGTLRSVFAAFTKTPTLPWWCLLILFTPALYAPTRCRLNFGRLSLHDPLVYIGMPIGNAAAFLYARRVILRGQSASALSLTYVVAWSLTWAYAFMVRFGPGPLTRLWVSVEFVKCILETVVTYISFSVAATVGRRDPSSSAPFVATLVAVQQALFHVGEAFFNQLAFSAGDLFCTECRITDAGFRRCRKDGANWVAWSLGCGVVWILYYKWEDGTLASVLNPQSDGWKPAPPTRQRRQLACCVVLCTSLQVAFIALASSWGVTEAEPLQ